jgi:PAS domain S-box-containing protein
MQNMRAENKTKEPVLEEMPLLRREIAALRALENGYSGEEEELRKSENRYRALFEHSPIPIWEEDFSEVKSHFDRLRASGVKDFRSHFENHPEEIVRLAEQVKILDVNQESVAFFEVTAKEEIPTYLPYYFDERSLNVFREEIIALAEGKTKFECEIPILTLNGGMKDLSLRLSVAPDYEETLSRVFVSFIDLTERKRAEEALRESEEKYSALVQQAKDGVIIIQDGILQFVNQALADILGYTLGEIENRPYINFVAPESRPMVYARVNARLAGEDVPQVYQAKLLRKDGNIIDAELSASVIQYRGKPADVGIIRDITERKRAEEALRKSEAKYRRLHETMMDAFVSVDMTGRIQEANRSYRDILGYSEEELRQLTYRDLTPEKWHAFEASIVEEQVLVQGYSKVYEKEYRKKDGTIFPVELRTFLMRDDTGQPVGMWAMVRDITERKRAEEALRENEERYRALFDRSIDWVYVHDFEGNLLDANPTALDLFGYEREDLPALKISSLLRPGEFSKALKVLAELKETGTHGLTHFRFKRKNGGYVDAETTGSVIFHEGKPYAVQGIARDITERKRAEKALQESEERYRRLVENAPLGIISMDTAGNIIDVNPHLTSILGLPAPQTSQAINIFAFPSLVEAGVAGNFRRCLESGNPGVIETRYFGKGGKESYLRYHLTSIRDGQEKVTGVQAIVEDISDRKKLENQLLHAQKMEAIGTLAGGIAHDFNNILAAILGYAELANLDVPEASKPKYNLRQAIKAAHRAKNLVQQILAFSRQDKQERKPLDIRPIIKEALKLLRASLPSTIAIRENIEADLGTIEADPTQIHQVLMNLCTNAAHAMSENGGRLEVSLAKFDMVPDISAVCPEIELGPYLKLTVSDTGHGMSPEILQRIYDPYFTTKDVGKGTGLGLAVVHGIVKSYRGAITVSSEPGKGTTFDIYLPRIDSVEAPSEIEKIEPLPIGGQERVLFVDDEKAIVEIGQRMLEHLGYEVVVRTSSIEALQLFRAQPDKFDLVITDMTMPNMTGEHLAQELMCIRPDIPVILCTGFSEHITKEKASALGICEFLMKPLVMKDLAKSARAAVDRRKRGGLNRTKISLSEEET